MTRDEVKAGIDRLSLCLTYPVKGVDPEQIVWAHCFMKVQP